MTEHTDDTPGNETINTLLLNGTFEGIPLIAEMLTNAAMILERARHLKVGAYERGAARDGQANGFKSRGLQTVEFELWRTRLLAEIAFIFLDATYITDFQHEYNTPMHHRRQIPGHPAHHPIRYGGRQSDRANPAHLSDQSGGSHHP